MKLAEWNNKQCSWWIANKIEPKRKLGSASKYAAAWGMNKNVLCWHVSNAGPWDDGSTTIPYYWEPRDMVSTPALTVLMLETMIAEYGPSKALLKISLALEELSIKQDVLLWSRLARRLGRAIAEAFMLANGWTEAEIPMAV